MKNILVAISLAASAVLLSLYLNERSKPPQIVERTVTVERKIEVPKEVIKEVPVDKIIEKQVRVPVEVIKEIPAKIPEEYEHAMDMYRKITKASKVNSVGADSFKGITSLRVRIFLNEKVKTLVDENLLRTKIELSLRRNGIALNEKSQWELVYAIEGLGITRGDGTETKTLSYTSRLKIEQYVLIPRDGEWFMIKAPIYDRDVYGVAPYLKIDSLISYAADAVDDFSNIYLAKNSR